VSYRIALKQFKIRIGSYLVAAFAIIIVATALRILLTAQGWPMTNSDESTMGLMALHIAYHGELPIFFYGQGYMGSLEAYLAAGLFRLFGPSVFMLRLGIIVMFALFMLSIYLLTSLLYSKKLALVTLALLSLGSQNLLFMQLIAIGGYAETLLFGSVLLLLATCLALTCKQDRSTPLSKWRIAAYGGWGLITGIAIWSDLLVLPFVITSALILIVFCRSERRVSTVSTLLLGLLIGIFPVILYNLTAPVLKGTLATSVGILLGQPGKIISPLGILQGIMGTLLVSLPSSTSAMPLCPIATADMWPLSGQSSPYVIQCSAIHGLWGLGFIVLFVIATMFALKNYRYYRQRWRESSTKTERLSLDDRQAAVRHFARLMILAAAGFTLVLYAVSFPASTTPASSGRYLDVLLIAIPAVLAPLLGAAKSATRFAKASLILRMGILLFIGIVFLNGTISTFAKVPATQSDNQQQEVLVHNLLRIGATHIYSEYWTCDRLAFVSNEHIICSVVDDQLQPGFDRYLPYRSIVQTDPQATYVFPLTSAQATAFAQKVALSNAHYQHFVFDGYVIYQPGS